MDLTGHVVAITGGTSGIGRATVDLLRARGAEVARIARGQAKASRVAGETGAVPFIADICDEDALVRAFEGVYERYGRLDSLVANAGVNVPEGLVHQLTTAKSRLAPRLRTPALAPRKHAPGPS